MSALTGAAPQRDQHQGGAREEGPQQLSNVGGLVMDTSLPWSLAGVADPAALSRCRQSLATKYEAVVAHSCFRFFDCDMHFNYRALNILVRELRGSTRDRERFFNATIGCRRRMDRKWQDTPLAKVFTVPDEWIALKQKSQAVFFREALVARQLTHWEAFTAVDYDNNGLLSPAEFYGALLWLKVPGLTSEDVVDFLEAVDTNRDGLVDYQEYLDMLTPPGSLAAAHAVEQEHASLDDGSLASSGSAAAVGSDAASRVAEKVEPYGAELLREVIVHRRQAELLRVKEERAHLVAYKEALDVKVFEEELLASRARKGGANPLVRLIEGKKKEEGGEEEDLSEVVETDFKFSTNQYPLRLAPTGKNAFFPIFVGTAASRPSAPMTCPKKHPLGQANYSWVSCSNCKTRGIHWYCQRWCGFYCCSTCYDGDRREKEANRLNPARHPTYLRCYNGCSFTLQVPNASAIATSGAPFTVTFELRLEKMPVKGHVASLVRFSLPDLAQGRKKHNTNAFIDDAGRVVCAAPRQQPLPPLVSAKAAEPTAAATATAEAKPTAEEEKKKKPIATTRHVILRPFTWHVVTLSVNPLEGSMRSYIDGELCHELPAGSAELNHLKLQHKLVVLGGGRQSDARGGDVRRVVIHNAALDESPSAGIANDEIKALFLRLAQANPAIGGRATRIQAIYRGFIVRRRRTRELEAEKKALEAEAAGGEATDAAETEAETEKAVEGATAAADDAAAAIESGAAAESKESSTEL